MCLSSILLISGMDGSTAYTKKDLKGLKGSSELRRQVKLPKVMLGYCTPLALETNGKYSNDLQENFASGFYIVFTMHFHCISKVTN
jgi:hypothetical protein